MVTRRGMLGTWGGVWAGAAVVALAAMIACGVSAGAAGRRQPEQDMSQMLTLQLKLDRADVVRGESARFTIVVQNEGAQPVQGLLKPSINSDCAWIDAVSPSRKLQASIRSQIDREGLYSHGPRDLPTITIPPKGKVEVAGDILTWFGEMPSETYQLTAYFDGPSGILKSGPAALKVWPADPVALETPRIGETMSSAGLTGAWVHKFATNAPEAGKFAVFLQVQSHVLPKSPIHGLRAAIVPAPVEPMASTNCDEAGTTGHVVWPDGRGVQVATVNFDAPSAAPPPPTPVRVPYAGAVMSSPMTDGDGTLWMPYRDAAGSKMCVVRVSADEPVTTVETPLGQTGPVGRASWLWEYDARAHVAWAKTRGREVNYARLPLTEPEAGFSTPTSVVVDDAVIWLEGYMDAAASRLRQPKAEEAPAPDPVFYAVLGSKDEMTVVRINMVYRTPEKVWSVGWPQTGPCEVLHAVVTSDQDLAMLLTGADGQIYFADSARRIFKPLREVAGVAIQASQRPGLYAASRDGVKKWLYVRAIERGSAESTRIGYWKLAPIDVAEPVPTRPRKESGVSQVK